MALQALLRLEVYISCLLLLISWVVTEKCKSNISAVGGGRGGFMAGALPSHAGDIRRQETAGGAAHAFSMGEVFCYLLT